MSRSHPANNGGTPFTPPTAFAGPSLAAPPRQPPRGYAKSRAAPAPAPSDLHSPGPAGPSGTSGVRAHHASSLLPGSAAMAAGSGAAAESSFSLMRDDPEASRSGLLGMSPLVFRPAAAAAAAQGAGGGGGAQGSPAFNDKIQPPSLDMGNHVLPSVLPPSSRRRSVDTVGTRAQAHADTGATSADLLGLLQRMRMWRTDAMHHHLYDSAIFWGDKILSLEESELAWNDAYWLAQAYFITHQYARAEALLVKPLRSAHTRRAAEERTDSLGLSMTDPLGIGTSSSRMANLSINDYKKQQPVPRAVDVVGLAISRARETAVLPQVLLDKLPPKGSHSIKDAGSGRESDRLPPFGSSSARYGLSTIASSSSLAGKRKERTFTVSGTGTGSSVGDHDGENASIESGNSGSSGIIANDDDIMDMHGNTEGNGTHDSTDLSEDDAARWDAEDSRNLKDVADRKLAGFDGPVLASISLACRCLAAQCQVRLGRYYDALETLGGDTAPWNVKAQESIREPTADGGIKLGSTAHYLRGQIYMRLDDLAKARECFEHALAIDVKNYEAFCALVNGNLQSVAEQWRFISALEYSAQAGEHPEDAEFIRHMYTSRLPKRDAEHLESASQARASLVQKFKLQDNADVLWSLAEELFAQMRYADAFTVTSRIMQLSRDHEGAMPIHVTCMFYMPKMRPALFVLAHRLVDDDPESPSAWYAVGAWYASAGRWAEARRYFSKATLLDPRFAPSWIAFGHSFANEGESDQAITAYATAARKFPFSHLPKLFIGMEHVHQGNLKLADVFLRGALDASPTDPLALNELGVLEYLTDNVENAIRLFEKALAVSEEVQEPASAWTVTHMNLACALRSLGRDEEAKRRFLRVIELEPINIAAHVGVGMCEHKVGNLSAAMSWYHDALALNPRDIFCTSLLDMALEESLKVPHVQQSEYTPVLDGPAM
ncbi:anaphase-promoting complex subunit Cut9 [Tilletia horrida]|nr:anaphase-promoting complex subunit Cut9 [Tilletia horrida]